MQKIGFSPYQEAIEYLKTLAMVCTDAGIKIPEVDAYLVEALKKLEPRS